MVKFYATMYMNIPGSFVDFWISRIVQTTEGTKPVTKPVGNYTLDNKEIIPQSLGIVIQNRGIAYTPLVSNGDRIKDAVFEIEKTARAKYRIIRYVGQLKTTTKNEIIPAEGITMTPKPSRTPDSINIEFAPGAYEAQAKGQYNSVNVFCDYLEQTGLGALMGGSKGIAELRDYNDSKMKKYDPEYLKEKEKDRAAKPVKPTQTNSENDRFTDLEILDD